MDQMMERRQKFAPPLTDTSGVLFPCCHTEPARIIVLTILLPVKIKIFRQESVEENAPVMHC